MCQLNKILETHTKHQLHITRQYEIHSRYAIYTHL